MLDYLKRRHFLFLVIVNEVLILGNGVVSFRLIQFFDFFILDFTTPPVCTITFSMTEM